MRWGVTVALWVGDPSNVLDSEQVDVPWGGSLLVELQTTRLSDVGTGGGFAVVDPVSCLEGPQVVTAWDTGNGGLGWVLPDGCGGSCGPSDTGMGSEETDDGPTKCGCASAPGSGWLGIGALKRRRGRL